MKRHADLHGETESAKDADLTNKVRLLQLVVIHVQTFAALCYTVGHLLASRAAVSRSKSRCIGMRWY
jgi:hypothetical protein